MHVKLEKYKCDVIENEDKFVKKPGIQHNLYVFHFWQISNDI